MPTPEERAAASERLLAVMGRAIRLITNYPPEEHARVFAEIAGAVERKAWDTHPGLMNEVLAEREAFDAQSRHHSDGTH